MYPKMKNDEYISKFLPDYPKGQLPEKTFFHCIICSIYPEQMFQIVYEAQKKRAVLNRESRDDKVEITDEIAKEIDAIISLPSKPILWL